MSIYATWLAIDDDHDFTCPRWVRCKCGNPDAPHEGVGEPMAWGDGKKHWTYDKTRKCTCNAEPLVYAGSHVNPSNDDPRGGYLLACAIPNFLHPDADPIGEDTSKPVEFLRLSLGEDPSTYHGMEPGHATVVLNRKHVKALAKTLNQWLKSEERA
jgi:hypothetical protein